MTQAAKHAYHYTKRLGWGLCPIPKGSKAPKDRGWQQNPITDPEQARQVWASGQNMGLIHDVSRTCTIDVDNADFLKLAAAALDFDLLGLIEAAPLKIQGKNGAKPLYRLPDGATLDHHKLNWPHPTEKLENGNPRQVTVVEFRAGAGKQDVLPPSIHPDTHQPYQWVGTPPRSREDVPELPAELVAFWQNLPEHIRTMKAACPWAEPEKVKSDMPHRATPYTGESAIDAFNAKYTVQDILERNGYKRRGQRYLGPSSSTKMPAVVLYDDGGKTRARSYHGSDSWADNHGHDAFDLFTNLECQGDLRTALELTRAEFGMQRPTAPIPANEPTAEQVQAAWEEHSTRVLEYAAYRLSQNMHHRAHQAVVDILGWAYQSAADGLLTRTPKGTWAVQVGGIKGFAALLGGHPSDLRARLQFLTDQGCLRTEPIDPNDPKSGKQIILPANPLDLPIMSAAPSGPDTPLRPQTREIRIERSFNHPTLKEARQFGGGIKNATPSLRALARVALALSQHPGIPLEALADRLRMRKDTTRRKLSELREAGWLTERGNLRGTFREFFAAMRAEEGVKAVPRVEKALNSTKDYFERRLLLSRLGVNPDPEAPSIARRLAKTNRRLERLADGEAPHMVLGVAA